jgi:hypothetical protein
LVIGESDALSAELFAIEPVFGFQIFNHGLLVPIHPAGEEGENKPQVEIPHIPGLALGEPDQNWATRAHTGIVNVP